MYALSAAIKAPIRSYYPPQLQPELASDAYSRKVIGRNVKTIYVNQHQCYVDTNVFSKKMSKDLHLTCS